MPTFHLTMKEHEEYGGLGIACNLGRDYFQPAIGGIQVAHDILEHSPKPHGNGYIDEFMAIGALIAGRIASGWMSQYGRRINTVDIIQDVESLTTSVLMSEYDLKELCPERCTSYLHDESLMIDIRSSVREGIINAINEYEDADYTSIPSDYPVDVDSIVGWICKGYQLYKKRFNRNLYDVSTFLFDRITLLVDNWAKGASEGETAELKINFSSLTVDLIEPF